jgi:hypothetical protein
VDRESLFDLEIDPNETNNLAGDQQYDSMKTILRASLDKWWSL